MVADGYHSLVDGSNNVIGLVVASLAYRPPDLGHPYGHRKFETAATVFISGALLVLAYRVVEGAFASVAGSHAPVIGWLNWAKPANAASISASVAACRTWSYNPRWTAAAVQEHVIAFEQTHCLGGTSD